MSEKFEIADHSVWIKRHPRRKRLALRVRSGRIELLSPPNLSDKRLFQFAEKHQAWWLQALEKLPEPTETQSLSVEDDAVWPLLDSQVRLRFESGRSDFDWDGETLVCRLASHDCPQKRRKALQAWWSKQAYEHLSQRTEHFAQQTGLFPKQVQIKSYRARWGSCDRFQRIQFNWKLMTLPSWVVDYVVVHELCHLAHMNHSSQFWDLVKRHYPLTPQAKKWLKLHGYQRIQQLS